MPVAEWKSSADWPHPTGASSQPPSSAPGRSRNRRYRLVEPESGASAALLQRTHALDAEVSLSLAEMERGYTRLGISRGSLRPGAKFEFSPRPPAQRSSARRTSGGPRDEPLARPTTAEEWAEDRRRLCASNPRSARRPVSSHLKSREKFQPCAKFDGERADRVFKNGPLGLGYYLDRGATFARHRCRAAGAYDSDRLGRLGYGTEFDWKKQISSRRQRTEAIVASSAERSAAALDAWHMRTKKRAQVESKRKKAQYDDSKNFLQQMKTRTDSRLRAERQFIVDSNKKLVRKVIADFRMIASWIKRESKMLFGNSDMMVLHVQMEQRRSGIGRLESAEIDDVVEDEDLMKEVTTIAQWVQTVKECTEQRRARGHWDRARVSLLSEQTHSHHGVSLESEQHQYEELARGHAMIDAHSHDRLKGARRALRGSLTHMMSKFEILKLRTHRYASTRIRH
eukprot:SAG31_NODE_969_length_10677_cov_7.080072_10_plen_455_part_00